MSYLNLVIAVVVSLIIFWLQGFFALHPLSSLLTFGIVGLALYILLGKLLKLPAYQLAEGVVRKRLPSRKIPA